MFSEKINSMLQTSGETQAFKRAQQLEGFITLQTRKTEATAGAEEAFKTILDTKAKEITSNGVKNILPRYNVKNSPISQKARIETIVQDKSQTYGLDKDLIMAIISQESNFNPNAVSNKGATGLMQLMPETARSLGVLNSKNPEENIEGGVKYLKELMGKYNGNMILALSAYNAGMGNVEKYGTMPPFEETQDYVWSVLDKYLEKK